MPETPPPTDELTRLRTALDEVDADLVALVARRAEIVRRIGAAKQATGRATRDYTRERVVIEGARSRAGALGVDADLAEALMRALIDDSLAAQEGDRVAATEHGDGQRALVIGGAGKMGSWFARFLRNQGFDVAIVDPAGPLPGFPSVDDWRGDHDLVVVAAPLPATAALLGELAQEPPPGVIFDVASLKGTLRPGLDALRAAGARVTSLHPMFGPDARLLSGRHVVLCDCGVPEATAAARALFAPTMAAIVEMSLEEHDRTMAFVLGLSHAVNIAFFTALQRSGATAPRLAEISSTTFAGQLEVARRVAGESPELYYEIQAANAWGGEALDALAAAAETLRDVVAARDRDAFGRLMTEGAAYLARLEG
ncbi:MAG: prephenate dehydrogenase/arogenate dehydrogenase family protein [Myxococcota bacterium]